MTPLVSYVATLTPAQALINTVWCAITVPEIAATYLPANGSTVVASGGVPIPGPLYRSIDKWKCLVYAGASITAGTVAIYELGLDGNWRIASNVQALTASTNYGAGVGAGTSVQITGGGKIGNPTSGSSIGLAFVFTVALLGGNVTYMEISGSTRLIDPRSFNLVNPVKL